ncbi:UNVERIFIED_CONTAM: hypothetical protein Cloal_1832 [Acetivibrio alkalicellulosi]
MRKNSILVVVIAIVLCVTSFIQPVFAEEEIVFQIEKDNEYFGFMCKEIIENIDKDSDFYIFKDIITGAQLVWLKNSDINKAFSVSFMTPPENNKGIPHIVEHSVLRGSESYPLKNPFALIQSYSHNTFANAITYPLFTSFPIASRNDKDFFNSMQVYLDGIFAPRFLEDERIFKQEGIRKEIFEENDNIVYNGVVYNEMKGYERTPFRHLFYAINSTLYKDTPYRYDSGGKTENIKYVTYEETKEFYLNYYHPSNALFFFYGDVDIIKYLQYINNEYLIEYDRKERVTIDRQQESGLVLEGKYEYSIPTGSTKENKTYMSLSYMICEDIDYIDDVGLSLIALVLSADNSPLREKLKEAGFNGGLSLNYSIDYIQPRFDIIVTETDEDKRDLFIKTVSKVLEEILNEKLDIELTNAILDIVELNTYQSSSTNSWLSYMENIALNWVAEKPLYNRFESFQTIINNIREKIDEGYLEGLIDRYLIKCNHSALVVMKPVPGLQDEKAMEDYEELKKYKESLTIEQLDELIKESEKLRDWYQEEESPELLKIFPTLTLEDIDTSEIIETVINKEMIGDATILHTPEDIGELVYTDMYFDTTRVPQEKLKYLFLLDDLLGNISTEKYTYNQLKRNELKLTGGIQLRSSAFGDSNNADKYYPKFNVYFYNLINNHSDVMDLINEIIYNSKFDEIDRIKEIVSSRKNAMRNSNPTSYVATRVLSYNSETAQYNEIRRIEYYDFLCEVEKLLETKPEAVITLLEETYKLAFPKQEVIIGVICQDEKYPLYREKMEDVIESLLKPVESKKHNYNLKEPRINEAFIDPSSFVQYVAKGYNFNKYSDYEYSGKMIVLSNILNDFVFNAIRMFGAYGAQFDIRRNGSMLFVSWDNQNIEGALWLFDYIGTFLEDFELSDEEMANYIIGSIGKYNQHNTLQSNAWLAQEAYISNSDECRAQIIEEMLSTTVEDIRGFAPLFKQFAQEGNYSVWGNEQIIMEHGDIFAKIITVFEEKSDTDEKIIDTGEEKPKSTPRPKSSTNTVVSPTPTPIPTPTPTANGEVEEPTTEIPSLVKREQKAYIKGYEDGLFRPERHITRAEAAVIIANILKFENINNYKENTIYTDVSDSHWASEAISLVSYKGLFKGYTDGSFKPDQNITRAEFSTVVFKLLQIIKGVTEVEICEYRFEDTKGHWAQKYIEQLSNLGTIKGYSDGTFKPQNMINRAESVALINRAIDRVPLSDVSKFFNDVDESHWAFYDIASAAIDYTYVID